ncbi:MAG: UvrB/UvrC motif-containing protein [Clostridia bacterium]|nr:UvrB/UvrC motif-containing protein [Clostridia bacterium]
MLCEKCKKNPATIIYKENINGQTKSFALCAACASEQGEIQSFGKYNASDAFGVLDNMNSIFGSLFGIPSQQVKRQAEEKKCTLCGAHFSDLVKDGKAGCPECYKVFADELAPTISRIHGVGVHAGTSPERFKEGRERKEKIAELELKLKKAIEAEEYEEAAKLRDMLRELRQEDSGM